MSKGQRDKASPKQGVSLTNELRAIAMQRAAQAHKGNFSGYIQSLIVADSKGLPPPSTYDSAILAQLAKVYAGYLAPTLEKQLADVDCDQPRLLHTLLVQLSDYLAAGGTPQQLHIGFKADFAPFSHEEYQQKHASMGSHIPPGQKQSKAGFMGQIAAEQQAPYGVTPKNATKAQELLREQTQHTEPPTPPVPPP